MMHAMTYDHLSSEQSDGRRERRTRWLNGLHADEKKKIFIPVSVLSSLVHS